MSIIDLIIPSRRRKREAQLEKRVAALESHLVNVAQTLKSVTDLALRMSSELEVIAKHAKAQSHRRVESPPPPEDDFYN